MKDDVDEFDVRLLGRDVVNGAVSAANVAGFVELMGVNEAVENGGLVNAYG